MPIQAPALPSMDDACPVQPAWYSTATQGSNDTIHLVSSHMLPLPHLPSPLQSDATLLRHAVLNLAVNAAEAMSSAGGGTLRFATNESDVPTAPAARAALGLPPGARPGHYIVLSVSDTGPGVIPAALPHLFEPYTTKPGAAGLGLPAVLGLAADLGGWVDVETGPWGSVFALWIPSGGTDDLGDHLTSGAAAIDAGNDIGSANAAAVSLLPAGASGADEGPLSSLDDCLPPPTGVPKRAHLVRCRVTAQPLQPPPRAVRIVRGRASEHPPGTQSPSTGAVALLEPMREWVMDAANTVATGGGAATSSTHLAQPSVMPESAVGVAFGHQHPPAPPSPALTATETSAASAAAECATPLALSVSSSVGGSEWGTIPGGSEGSSQRPPISPAQPPSLNDALTAAVNLPAAARVLSAQIAASVAMSPSPPGPSTTPRALPEEWTLGIGPPQAACSTPAVPAVLAAPGAASLAVIVGQGTPLQEPNSDTSSSTSPSSSLSSPASPSLLPPARAAAPPDLTENLADGNAGEATTSPRVQASGAGTSAYPAALSTLLAAVPSGATAPASAPVAGGATLDGTYGKNDGSVPPTPFTVTVTVATSPASSAISTSSPTLGSSDSADAVATLGAGSTLGLPPLTGAELLPLPLVPTVLPTPPAVGSATGRLRDTLRRGRDGRRASAGGEVRRGRGPGHRASARVAGSANAKASSPPLMRMNVLLVDDEPIVQMVGASSLVSRGALKPRSCALLSGEGGVRVWNSVNLRPSQTCVTRIPDMLGMRLPLSLGGSFAQHHIGQAVNVAGDGAPAVEIVRRHPHRYDVVFLDIKSGHRPSLLPPSLCIFPHRRAPHASIGALPSPLCIEERCGCHFSAHGPSTSHRLILSSL